MLTEIQRVALIPAYEPEDGLVNLVVQLSDAHFKIVLVDDGSGEQYRRFFRRPNASPSCSHTRKTAARAARSAPV